MRRERRWESFEDAVPVRVVVMIFGVGGCRWRVGGFSEV